MATLHFINDISFPWLQVDIRFGAADSDGQQNRNLVVISGNEENCFDCRDHLLNMEEEFLQDIADQVNQDEMRIEVRLGIRLGIRWGIRWGIHWVVRRAVRRTVRKFSKGVYMPFCAFCPSSSIRSTWRSARAIELT